MSRTFGFTLALLLGAFLSMPAASADDTGAAVPAEATEPAAGAPAAAATGDAEYARRLELLRRELLGLGEAIRNLETRVATLETTSIADPSETAQVVLIHRNEMGDAFVLESVRYLLDDSPIYGRIDPGAELDAKVEFEIFNGRLRPGRYTISVNMVYRGHGYGVYSYLKGYRFKIRSSYTFEAVRGGRTCLKIVAYERETDSEDLRDRPQVRYDPSPECKADPLGARITPKAVSGTDTKTKTKGKGKGKKK